VTTLLSRTSHTFHFRVANEEDVTVQGTTVSPRDLDVQFLDEEGARTTRAWVTGYDREPDGTLNRHRSHSLCIDRADWPRWVARRVAECTPEGWGPD
jgi:hypothetical protein